MLLHQRMNGIVNALNRSDKYLTAREICNTFKNPDEVTLSDTTSVQSILNVMILMNYVKSKNVSKNKSPRYGYVRLRRIDLYNGIA